MTTVYSCSYHTMGEGDAQRLRGDLDAAAKLYDHAIEAGSRNELPWCGCGRAAAST